jgi:hypothetical protein
LIEKEHNPTICPVFECKSDWYWSSSSYVGGPGGAWVVFFDDGYVGSGGDGKGLQGFVRAVRSGP